MTTPEYIQTDFELAKSYYSTQTPRVLGLLTLSQTEAESLPLSLDSIYATAFEAIERNPLLGQQWASTFGKLSVAVALNNKPTNFNFCQTSSAKSPEVAEISTNANRALSELLFATELDSDTTYLLGDTGRPRAVEMALIQALHMMDAAMVTNQFDGSLPLVLATNDFEKLKRDYPEALLRIYGNVRRLGDVPIVLGCVLPTSVVERLGLETNPLNNTKISNTTELAVIEQPPIRQPASFIGITTAKRPHVGHGLLLARAIAEAGTERRVVVEFNDNGPRVNQTVAFLADSKVMTLEAAAKSVSDGTIGIELIEEAYRNRSQVEAPANMPKYALAAANQYYRELLRTILPPLISVDLTPDSGLDEEQADLRGLPGYVSLFGSDDMSLLRNKEGKAIVITAKGRPTLAGILAILSTRYRLKLIDSPPPLSSQERAIFSEVGLGVEQSTGTGIMIDFSVASGTRNDAIQLERLLDLTLTKTGNPHLLLPALRELMNRGYFLPSEGASFSVNFANNDAALEAYQSALDGVMELDDPFAGLFQAMSFRDIRRDMVIDLLKPVYDDNIQKGKATVGELRRLVATIPTLGGSFSDSARELIARSDLSDDQVVQKNLLDQKDQQIIHCLRVGNPEKAIPILLEFAKQFPEDFKVLTKDSLLTDIIKRMGYNPDDVASFLNRLKQVRGVYKLQ